MIRLYEGYTRLRYGNGPSKFVGEIGDWSFGFGLDGDSDDKGDYRWGEYWVTVDFFKAGEKHRWYSSDYDRGYEARSLIDEVWDSLCEKYQESTDFGKDEITSVLKSYDFSTLHP